jgi:UDP-N-acetylmuramate dehydrogenase
LRHYQNISLKGWNTMSLDMPARVAWCLDDQQELPLLLQNILADASSVGAEPVLPLLVGGGSNVIFAHPLERPLVRFDFAKIRLVGETDHDALVEVQAGAHWHQFVLWSLEQGLSGLENLSLIPGSVGASPVQNIGAYGVELRDCLDSVQVFDVVRALQGQKENKASDLQSWYLSGSECGFAYRDSIFKHQANLWITSVRFRLRKQPQLNLDYADIKHWLRDHHLIQPTPKDVSNAVIAIRQKKLPDPAVLGNAGSFFKNPVMPIAQALALTKAYPKLPNYPSDRPGQVKVSAGWLIEQCGLKGHREGDAGVHQAHALVLVNHGRASGQDIVHLAQVVQKAVRARFQIELEIEPTII